MAEARRLGLATSLHPAGWRALGRKAAPIRLSRRGAASGGGASRPDLPSARLGRRNDHPGESTAMDVEAGVGRPEQSERRGPRGVPAFLADCFRARFEDRAAPSLLG